MGVRTDFQDSSMVIKIAFVVALVANFCNWLAFTTTDWLRQDVTGADTHSGLWRSCGDVALTSCNLLDGQANSRYAAIQSFAIFGFVSLNVSFILIILYIWLDRCKDDKDAGIAAAVLAFIAAVTWLIAVVIFGERYGDRDNQDLHYSFGMAICALILAIVTGVLMIVGSRSGSSVGSK